MQKKLYSFKKINRLKSKKSFQVVYNKGRSVVDGMSVFFFFGLKSYSEVLSSMAEDFKQRIYMLAGEEFNINSPKQLG